MKWWHWLILVGVLALIWLFGPELLSALGIVNVIDGSGNQFVDPDGQGDTRNPVHDGLDGKPPTGNAPTYVANSSGRNVRQQLIAAQAQVDRRKALAK